MMQAARGGFCVAAKLFVVATALSAQAVTGTISPDSQRVWTGRWASVSGVCSVGTPVYYASDASILKEASHPFTQHSFDALKAGRAYIWLQCGAQGHRVNLPNVRAEVFVNDPPPPITGNIAPASMQLQVGQTAKAIGACTQGAPGFEPNATVDGNIFSVSTDGAIRALKDGRGAVALLCGDPTHRIRVAQMPLTVIDLRKR